MRVDRIGLRERRRRSRRRREPGEYVDWGIPWQEQTRTIGAIVGEPERANEMVEEVEARLEQIRAEPSGVRRATGATATPYEGVWVYGPEDSRGRLLDSLGFVMPSELEALATDEFGFDLSLERLDLLDLDVLIWLDARTPGRRSPRMRSTTTSPSTPRDVMCCSTVRALMRSAARRRSSPS